MRSKQAKKSRQSSITWNNQPENNVKLQNRRTILIVSSESRLATSNSPEPAKRGPRSQLQCFQSPFQVGTAVSKHGTSDLSLPILHLGTWEDNKGRRSTAHQERIYLGELVSFIDRQRADWSDRPVFWRQNARHGRGTALAE